MEDFSLDVIIGQGPGARSHKLKIKRFTLVGATTRAGKITAPLRSRFGIVHRLDYYQPEDLKKIILRSARILKVKVEESGAEEIARRRAGHPVSPTACSGGCGILLRLREMGGLTIRWPGRLWIKWKLMP